MDSSNTETVEDIEKLLDNQEPKRQPAIKRLPPMPAGKLVVAMMDESGTPMTDEDRKRLGLIADEEAMAAFLEANLGTEPFIGELKARSLFGSYMMKKMDHQAIGFATRYMNIVSTQKCKEFARNLAEKCVTDEDKINATKVWLSACHSESVILKRYVDMAQELAPPEKPGPNINKAPDISVENANILVQYPSGTNGGSE